MKAPGMQVDPAGSTRVLMDLNKVEGSQGARGVQKDPEGSTTAKGVQINYKDLTGSRGIHKDPEGSTSVLTHPYQLEGSQRTRRGPQPS